MKINEVIVNEGIADTLKTGFTKGIGAVKSAAQSDTAKNVAGAVGNVAGSAFDAVKTGLYRNFGVGGVKGEELAVKDNFIKRFEQQFKNNLSAARAAGQGQIDTNQMVDSYLATYGWVANPQDKQILKTLADQASKRPGDVTKLANYMYTVGSKQMRDPSGRVMPQMPQGTAQAGTAQAGAAGEEQPDLSSVSNQIVKQINTLKGQGNFDDLKTISKSAMQALYKQSPSEYAKLYKEVMRGRRRK